MDAQLNKLPFTYKAFRKEFIKQVKGMKPLAEEWREFADGLMDDLETYDDETDINTLNDFLDALIDPFRCVGKDDGEIETTMYNTFDALEGK